jgi:hypothetical protein
MIPKQEKIYQMSTKSIPTNCYIHIPNGHKIDQHFPSEALDFFPKLGFFGLKNKPSGSPVIGAKVDSMKFNCHEMRTQPSRLGQNSIN